MRTLLISTLFFLCCMPSRGHAQTHGFLWANGVFETIDFPSAESTLVSGVNDRLETVGSWRRTSLFHDQHFLASSDGAFLDLEVPGVSLFPNDVNNHGDIVGGIIFGAERPVNVIIHSANDESPTSTVDLPNLDVINLRGINDFGEVVGHYGDNGFVRSFYLEANENVTTIEVPNATNTFVGGVNNKGEIVGGYQDSQGGYHGYLLSGEKFHTTDVPGFTHSFIEDINETGDFVGWVSNSLNSRRRGFLHRDGEFQILQVPGSVYTEARGISSNGEVVGIFVVPEPSSSALLPLGVAVLLVVCRHRF